jgi:TrmH family RNA methyltransferase
MEHITSRQNAHFKQARKLAGSARERNKSQQIVMDGIRLVGAYALEFGLQNSTLLVSEEGAGNADIQQILRGGSARHSYCLAPDLFADYRAGRIAGGHYGHRRYSPRPGQIA